MSLLVGKNAIITGARRGIGRATVEIFAREGANVWACARSADGEFVGFCNDLSDECDVWVEPVFFDLENKDQVISAVKRIRSDRASVTSLVNCAGIVAPGASFAMSKKEDIIRVLDVNLVKQIEFTQYVLRLMTDGASIVNLSSIAASGGMPGQYGYACSKGAVETWTNMLAQELGERHIRVNAIAPGFVNTDMGNQAAGDLLQRILDSTVMKRMAEPKEIANVIAVLSSDMCSYVTGQTIYADGGVLR